MRTIFFVFNILLSITLSAQVQNIKKGDVLVVNGVKGIVFQVDDSGCHGRMMSVNAFRRPKNLFCTKLSRLKNVDMSSCTDGKLNTENLFKHAASQRISLSEFPVFKWCKELGPGWYIPSVEQLRGFIMYWFGTDEVEENWEEDDESPVEMDDHPQNKIVNEILLNAGGIPFLNGVFTSTMHNKGCIDLFKYDKESGKWEFVQVNPMKIDAFSVGRAFYDF